MNKGYFITGTDTGIGKTWITAGLLRAGAQRGWRTVGLKPVASGCARVEGQLRNEDALLLMEHASEPLAYEQVNPCALELPVSPHLAAEAQGRAIDIGRLAAHCHAVGARADVCLVEGVGGWLAPLGPDHTVADLALALDLPVILVVGIRLGCLNHALLSQRAIRESGAAMAGWVANVVDAENLLTDGVIATLAERLDAPCLGTVPCLDTLDAGRIAAHLDTGALWKS